MADGYLRIKTKIDNSEVDAGMMQLERELQTAEKQADVLYQKFNRLNKQLKNMPSWKDMTPEYAKLKDQVAQAEIAFEKAGDKAGKLKDKLQAMSSTQTVKAINDVRGSVDKIGTSIGSTIKKVFRWTMAVFGVSSAYFAVRNAMSTLSSYNEQIKTDLDYIRFAMATALQPIVEAIIRGAFKLLQFVNAISMQLFNFNLFGKSSAKNFGSMNKSAKELKKTLAGFDEMNVLADQSGQTGGTVTPSMDLSKTTSMLDGVSQVLTDTINFWEKEWMDYFGFFKNEWDLAFIGILITLEGFYNIFKGIMEVLKGAWYILVGIFTGDFEKIKEGFGLMCEGIKNIFIGLIQIITGLFVTALGIIVGLFVSIVNWIKVNVITPIANFGKGLWDNWVNGAKIAWSTIKSVFSGFADFFGSIISKAWSKVKTAFTVGGIIFNGIKDGIASVFKTVVNKLIDGINVVVGAPFKAINSMLNKIRSTSVLGVSPFKNLWNKNPIGIPTIPKLATGGVVNRPTRAIIGEAGAERIIPLSQDAEWIEKVANAFANKVNNGGGAVNVYLDGRLIQRQIEKKTEELAFARNR